MRILITGAAGNLGGFLARSLIDSHHRLRLMVHKTEIGSDLCGQSSVEVVSADLGNPATLEDIFSGVDCAIHFAGVLSEPRPARFLPTTNVIFVKNLLDGAMAEGVGKVILVSFPHVEGDTSPDQPTAGRLDRTPPSIHA